LKWASTVQGLKQKEREEQKRNPYVGGVVVKEGAILGTGFTQPPGGAHAEAMAIQSSEGLGLSVNGATVYSTVEPCSFFGRTPSCAKMLVEKKIGRVVIGIRDPHPRVNGNGIEILKAAGIEVLEGICADEIRSYLAEWLSGFQAKI